MHIIARSASASQFLSKILNDRARGRIARVTRSIRKGVPMSWLTATLRSYPEIAVFLSLGVGYWVGGKSFKGFALGSVTATLLAAIAIGQLGITISPNVKSVFFLMFLFAVGYGVGPQFVRGIAKDGLPQALFSVIQCVLCLAAPYLAAKVAGYDVGSAAGLFAGSQTISASMGLATDAINRLGLPPEQAKVLLDAMPTAYAVTYIYGTIGSALILAMLGPKLLGIDLVAACKAYEAKLGGGADVGHEGTAWHQFTLRAYRVAAGGRVAGLTVGQAEALEPAGARLFVERIRRGGKIQEARIDDVLQAGDVVAVAGRREQLVQLLGGGVAEEVDDAELLAVPVEGVDIYITSKEVDGKTLAELAQVPGARGVFIRHIKRGATETAIPVLPSTALHRGDTITLMGRTQDTSAVAKAVGVIDRPSDVADMAFTGLAITLGALIGAVVIRAGGIPITLSTAGGALIAGIVFGWLRAIHPTFGRIPGPTLWFMNSVGLNVFIAVVGITAGPGFVAGLQKLGVSLFLWGIFASSVPLIIGMYIAKYLFRFDPAILLGIVAGARTTTAALGMLCDAAKSQVPGLGYTVTYAVGNTLLTIWGMVMVMLLS
jgi:putative transport protein